MNLLPHRPVTKGITGMFSDAISFLDVNYQKNCFLVARFSSFFAVRKKKLVARSKKGGC